MHELKDWLPVLSAVAVIALAWGQLRGELGRVNAALLGELGKLAGAAERTLELCKRLEGKEDARGERERTSEGRFVHLESGFRVTTAELAALREAVAGITMELGHISGKFSKGAAR